MLSVLEPVSVESSILEALSTVIAPVIQKLEQQAEFSQQQAEFSQQQAEFSQQQAEFVNTQFSLVQSRLERIEADTVIIKGIVLSDFAGITATTKADIEEAAEIALEDKELIVAATEFFNKTNPAHKSAAFVAARKEINAFRLGQVVAGYTNETLSVSAIGVWVGAQMTKIFGAKLGGKYAASAQPLVEILIGYYLAERVSNGRQY